MSRCARWIAPAALVPFLLAPLASCTADVSSSEAAVVEQTVFDFTVVADRELFAEQDLEYFGTVGPYAIYEVTGDDPKLLGPRVRFDSRAAGLVMLCGAASYFAGDGEAEEVTMSLYGGADGDEELTQTRIAAITVDDGCSEADDRFTERVPGDEPIDMTTLEYTAEERITIGIDGFAPIGSRLLLRVAALDVPDREHNNASTIPRICCDGEYCTLDSAE